MMMSGVQADIYYSYYCCYCYYCCLAHYWFSWH